jgi:hypothetical protein
MEDMINNICHLVWGKILKLSSVHSEDMKTFYQEMMSKKFHSNSLTSYLVQPGNLTEGIFMEHIKLLNSISNYILLLPNHESEGKVKKVKIETDLPFKKSIEALATKVNDSSKGDQHNMIQQ